MRGQRLSSGRTATRDLRCRSAEHDSWQPLASRIQILLVLGPLNPPAGSAAGFKRHAIAVLHSYSRFGRALSLIGRCWT